MLCRVPSRPLLAVTVFAVGCSFAIPGNAQDLPDGDEGVETASEADAPDADVDSTPRLKTKALTKRIRARASTPGNGGGTKAEQRFWRDITFGLPSVPFTAVQGHPSDPEIIFVGADGFLFKTDDGGESWRTVLSFATGVPDDGITSNRKSFDNVSSSDAAVGLDRTQGVDFDQRAQALEDAVDGDPADFEDVASLPEGDFSDAAGVGEAQFPRQDSGVREITITGESVIYVATPRGLYRSVDTGEQWSEILVPGGVNASDIRAIAADPRRPTHLYVGTADGLFMSPDGGATMFRADDRVGRTPVLDVATDRLGSATVIVIGTEQGMFRAWDAGKPFTQVLLEGEGPFDPVTAVAFDPRDAVTYAGTPSGLFASERRGGVLEPRSAFSEVFVTSLSINPGRLRSLAVGARDDGVVLASATGLERVLQVAPLLVLEVTGLSRRAKDPAAIIAATERGVFVREKGTGMTVSRDVMRALYDRWEREPTLQEVANASLRRSGVHPENWDGMLTRSRWSALLPELQTEIVYWNGRFAFDFYVIDPEVLFDPAVDANDPESLEQLTATDAVFSPIVRGVLYQGNLTARWEPENLFYGNVTPTLLRMRPLQHKTEQKVLDRVMTAFVSRRRLLAEMMDPKEAAGPRVEVLRILRLQELTAVLDAASGDMFTRVSQERGLDDPSAPLAKIAGDRPKGRTPISSGGR